MLAFKLFLERPLINADGAAPGNRAKKMIGIVSF
jgi:hypothetical protein